MPNKVATAFQLSLVRLVHVVIASLGALALSSCSMVRIGYDAAPWYASWQLDRYWGLDSAQAAYGQDRIEEILGWHRRSELPEYARFLRRLNDTVQARPIDLNEATAWRRTLKGFWASSAQRIAPELTEIIVSLRPEQVERMKNRMASENNDYRKEFLPNDLSERQRRRIKRIEERIEEYLGEVTDRQRELVRQMARAMPQNEQSWYEERLARQQDMVALLERLRRSGQPLSDAQRQDAMMHVTSYLLSVWEPHDLQRRQSLERVMRASDEITVAVLNVATSMQKANLSRRLLGWADDLDALAR